jgi:hypothetical protein
MPDVVSNQPADVRPWVSLDVHKLSIVAATLPPTGGKPEVARIETTEKAIRRFIDKLGGPDGLAVCYEAGPGGFELYRLLTRLGVTCDVVAPSLIPVRAGDKVKTDRRDAKKLVTRYRGGVLRFVAPPTPETEGSAICCAAATISAAPAQPPGIASPSSFCGMGGSTARASTSGHASTATGSPANTSTMPSRTPNCTTPRPTSSSQLAENLEQSLPASPRTPRT